MTQQSPRFGIGGRLGVAFGLSALLAVIACLVGLLSYERLSASIRQISETDLPAAASSARIAQLASTVTAIAPLLSQSGSRDQLDQTAQQLRDRLSDMRTVLSQTPSAQGSDTLTIVDQLGDNLKVIQSETLVVLSLRQRNDEMLREIRALHSDFVEEAEPLVDDARFVIQTMLERIENSTAEPQKSVGEIRQRIRNAEAILQASSYANLAVGLLSRIASVSAIEQLTIDDHFLAETVDLIRAQLATMEQPADTLTLRQVLMRLIELSDSKDGMPGLRRRELEQQRLAGELLGQNRTLMRDLERQVAHIVSEVSERAARSNEQAVRSIALGRNLLALIAGSAILAAILMGVAYVRGSLIARIRALADAARTLGQGGVPPPIEVKGTDELADMARAMEGFRRTQNDLVQSAKLAALGHLSAGIAHELNQPLNAIRSQAHNAEVMHERGDAAGVTRALKKVQDLTARAGHIVGHLRRFSRRSDLSVVPVSVPDAVDGAALILGSRFKETGAKLTVDLPQELTVEADDIRLEQVFVNLLSNAIDAVAQESNGEITVSGERSNNVVRVTVADNGPGLATDVVDTLFDPFVTTKPPGDGVGLGLTISYNIIRDFGGALKALPNSKGASFVIELRAAGGV